MRSSSDGEHMDDWRSSPSQLKNFPRVVVFKKKKSDILSEWRGCVRLGRKAWVSRQKRETWYLCIRSDRQTKRHLTNNCFKKHVAWRLMIPTDKWSHFKAPDTKNNIYKQFCSHILDKITHATYENIMEISIEVFSRVSLWQLNDVIICTFAK